MVYVSNIREIIYILSLIPTKTQNNSYDEFEFILLSNKLLSILIIGLFRNLDFYSYEFKEIVFHNYILIVFTVYSIQFYLTS